MIIACGIAVYLALKCLYNYGRQTNLERALIVSWIAGNETLWDWQIGTVFHNRGVRIKPSNLYGHLAFLCKRGDIRLSEVDGISGHRRYDYVQCFCASCQYERANGEGNE